MSNRLQPLLYHKRQTRRNRRNKSCYYVNRNCDWVRRVLGSSSNWIKIINGLVFTILGVFGTLLTQAVSDYFHRPKITANFTYLSIEKSMDNVWSINTDIQFTNNGNKTSIEVTKIIVYFPSLNKRPYSIQISKTLDIGERESISETLSALFPDDLDKITKCPKLMTAKVYYKTFSSKKENWVLKDSSDLKWSSIFGGVYDKRGPISFKKLQVELPFNLDSLTPDMYGKYELNNYGKRTVINYYPVASKIEREYMVLYPIGQEYIREGMNLVLVAPTDLVGKVIVARNMKLNFAIQENKEDENMIIEYNLDMNNKIGGIFYTFK